MLASKKSEAAATDQWGAGVYNGEVRSLGICDDKCARKVDGSNKHGGVRTRSYACKDPDDVKPARAEQQRLALGSPYYLLIGGSTVSDMVRLKWSILATIDSNDGSVLAGFATSRRRRGY